MLCSRATPGWLFDSEGFYLPRCRSYHHCGFHTRRCGNVGGTSTPTWTFMSTSQFCGSCWYTTPVLVIIYQPSNQPISQRSPQVIPRVHFPATADHHFLQDVIFCVATRGWSNVQVHMIRKPKWPSDGQSPEDNPHVLKHFEWAFENWYFEWVKQVWKVTRKWAFWIYCHHFLHLALTVPL